MCVFFFSFPKSLSCPADTLYYLDDPMSQITLAGADKEHPETLERIAQELEKTKYDAVVMQVPSELFPFVEAVPTADAVQSARKEWQAQGIDETGMNLLTSASNSVILQGQAYDTFRAVYNMAKAKGIEVVPGEGSYVESLKAGMEDADNPNDFLVVSTRLNYHLARAYFKNAREIAERQKKSHVLAVAWLSKSPIFLAMWQRHDAMHSPITLDFADEASDSDRESQ